MLNFTLYHRCSLPPSVSRCYILTVDTLRVDHLKHLHWVACKTPNMDTSTNSIVFTGSLTYLLQVLRFQRYILVWNLVNMVLLSICFVAVFPCPILPPHPSSFEQGYHTSAFYLDLHSILHSSTSGFGYDFPTVGK